MNNDILAKFFEVSPELADELNLTSIIPKAVRDRRNAEPSARTAERSVRRELIRDWLKGRGRVPSIRTVRQRLEGEGYTVSFETVRRDIKAVLKGL